MQKLISYPHRQYLLPDIDQQMNDSFYPVSPNLKEGEAGPGNINNHLKTRDEIEAELHEIARNDEAFNEMEDPTPIIRLQSLAEMGFMEENY